MGFITLDLESTGLKPETDRIIQVAVVDEGFAWKKLVNPERPIPPDVTELTGISDATVADKPKFADIAAELAVLVAGQPIVTFNGLRFDTPLLAEEFERCGLDVEFGPVIDAGNLFKLHHKRRLAEAVQTYLGREHAEAHNALADAMATRDVFLKQLEQVPDIRGKTLEEVAVVSSFFKEPADPFGKLLRIEGRICYGTVRNRGVAVEDDPGYAEWMLRVVDFPLATKRVLRRELDRIKAKRVE